MKYNKHIAFTFIELLIVISLLMLLLTFVYLPYVHYQEKIKIRQVVREVSQGISEARNMAINGFDEKLESGVGFENKSIGLYLDNSEEKKGNMYFFSYPHTLLGSNIKVEEDSRSNISLLKMRKLPTGTQFDSANENMDNVIFFFNAISGKGEYYNFKSSGAKTEITGSGITLDFSYKGSTSSVLQKQLRYDTRINIVDF